jgi:hypothetical protein
MGAGPRTFVRVAGFCLGCALALSLVVAGRLPESRAASGADVLIESGRAAELVASPSGRIVAARALRPSAPGRGPRGAVKLWNPTDVPLAVRARAAFERGRRAPVHVAVAAGHRRLFSGPLSRLRGSAASALVIPAGSRARLSVRAWLRSSPGADYAGRVVRARLDFLTRIVRP